MASAGGLFLQVKLDTAGAEKELNKLGRTLSGSLSPDRTARAAAQAAAANARVVAAEQKKAAAEAVAGSRQAVQASRERVAELKNEAAQVKANADAEKARARQAASQNAVRNAETRATAQLAVEQQRLNRLSVQDSLLRRRRDELRALKDQEAALRSARKEAEALARTPGLSKVLGSLSGTTGQDLLVGLGAARSGNVAYGLAAVVRGFQGIAAGAAGAATAVVAASAAIVSVGIAAIASAASIGILAQKLVSAGTQGAANFELLRIQLQGLLGSASRGEQEFQWLLELGQTSIVPTQALIEADRTLLSFGVTSDNLRRSLVSFISEFGTAVGATQDQIYFLALAVSQVVAKGKADTVDLRQIANAGVNTQELLTIIGEKTGKTYREMTASLSEGKLTADLLLTGLIAYGDKFDESAKAASQSVKGLGQNIKDTFTTFLSNAFLNNGALQPIKDFLVSISDSLRGAKGLFDNLAIAARNLFDAVLGGQGARNAVGFLDNLFRNVLPGAVNAVAGIIRTVRPAIEAIVVGFQQLGLAGQQFFQSLAPYLPVIVFNLKLIGAALFVLVSNFTITGVIIAGTMTAAVRAVQALFFALTGNFGQAFASIRQGFIDMATTALRVQAIVAGTQAAFNATGSGFIAGNDDARNRSAERRGGGRTAGSGVDTDKAGADAQAEAARASASAQKVAQARDSLFNLIKSAFGQPSQVLSGLFGDAGKFTATVQSIASTAGQLKDALEQIPGTGGLVTFLTSQTKALIKLAGERDQVAKKLEDAQAKLDKLVEDRKALIQQLRDQAKDFVFSLNVGQTTAFRALDNAGSFAQTTVPESFAASVKRRLNEYKAFVGNIRKLQKAGLDKSLIKQFLQAGPEAAGAIVAQVASGGAGVISDLNAAQKELNKLAKEFGIEQGNLFYNAGIEQAQNLVNGLTARQTAIENAAKKATDAIIAKVKPLAAKMKDAGAAAGAGLSEGLQQGLGDFDLGGFDSSAFDNLFPDDAKIREKAENLVDNVLGAFGSSRFGRGVALAGQTIARGLLGGLTAAVFGVPAAVAAFLGSIGLSFDKLWPTVQGRFTEAFGSITDLLPSADDLAEKVRSSLGDVRPVLTRLRDNWRGLNIWSFIYMGMPSANGVLSRLRGTFNADVTGFLRNLPTRLVGTVGGGLWGFILSGLPSSSQVYERLKGVYNGFAAILRQMINAWNKLDFSFTFKVGPYTYTVDDIIPDISGVRIPALASGGIASVPTLAMIGDNKQAAEAVVPLTARGISTFMDGVGASGDTFVRVFIGDRELTHIVRTEVSHVDAGTVTGIRSRPRY